MARLSAGLLLEPVMMLGQWARGGLLLADPVSWPQSRRGHLSRSSKDPMARALPHSHWDGTDHWTPGTWALSGHPGSSPAQRGQGLVHGPLPPLFCIRPSKEAECLPHAGATGVNSGPALVGEQALGVLCQVARALEEGTWASGEGACALGPRDAGWLKLWKTGNSLIVRRGRTDKPWSVHSKECCSAVQMNKPGLFLSVLVPPERWLQNGTRDMRALV